MDMIKSLFFANYMIKILDCMFNEYFAVLVFLSTIGVSSPVSTQMKEYALTMRKWLGNYLTIYLNFCNLLILTGQPLGNFDVVCQLQCRVAVYWTCKLIVI